MCSGPLYAGYPPGSCSTGSQLPAAVHKGQNSSPWGMYNSRRLGLVLKLPGGLPAYEDPNTPKFIPSNEKMTIFVTNLPKNDPDCR